MNLDKRPRDPTAKDRVLNNIGEELKELRILYKKLVEKRSIEEKRAIQERDDIASEREIMKVLSKTNVRSIQRKKSFCFLSSDDSVLPS